jgi:hypothetical protein
MTPVGVRHPRYTMTQWLQIILAVCLVGGTLYFLRGRSPSR